MIFVSAMDEEQDELKGLAMGAVDYVSKPIDRNELLDKLAAYFLQT